MGWLSKIFKGSSHKISKWRYNGNSGEHFEYDRRSSLEEHRNNGSSGEDINGDKPLTSEEHQNDRDAGEGFDGNTPSSSEGNHNNENHGGSFNDDMPSSSGGFWLEQNEDIDRAIALSLAELDQRGNHIPDDRSPLEEDEKLARAIQESLSVESPPRYGNGTGYPPIPPQYGHEPAYLPVPYYSSGRICAGCQNEIGNGRYLTCMNGFWHPECFRCHACNLPISDYEFSMSGKYPYHKSCYRDNHHPKCDVCKHFIPMNLAGLIEYRVHPFWIQKYCPTHEHDGTPRCCSCEQLEPRDTKYVALKDGRKLCLECLDSAVMDTNECEPLHRDILKFYDSLNMKIEQYVPLLLVERQALNEARDGEKHGHYHMPETRGLCLSETQTIRTITRRPKFRAGFQAMDMVTEPYRLTRHCEVTAILVLYGLPRLLTGSILAHEMMHAWLRLKGYPTLRPDVEEGICQVLAHMWLEAELTSASSSSSSSSIASSKDHRYRSEKKLGQFFKHQIETDPSPVYGGGFRAGLQAMQKYGLQSTLDHILMTGTFPY